MKKFSVILVGVFMLLFSAAIAQAEEARLKANLNFGYFSRYIGGVNDKTLHDHSVFQQSIKLADTPTGLYFQIWSSYSPKGGINSDFGDEIDYIVGIYRNFYDGKLGIDMGYAFYNLYDLKNTEGDLDIIYLKVDLPEVYQIKPYISIKENIPRDKDIREGGFMYSLGVKYSFDLPAALTGQTVNMNLLAGGHDGALGKKPEMISFVRLVIATTFKIWKFDITPEVNFQKRLGHEKENGGMTEDKVWYGINFSVPLL